jgi:hypothetical protein
MSRAGASYRRGLGHGRDVEHMIELTRARVVRDAVRARSAAVEHVEVRFYSCPHTCLAALACLSWQGSRVGSLPCSKSLPFHVTPEL